MTKGCFPPFKVKVRDLLKEIPDILLQENKKILAYLKIIKSDSETTIKTVVIKGKNKAGRLY